MNILYYTLLCPDCPPFIEALDAKGVIYEKVDITANIGNLKRFIQLRDQHVAFGTRKQKGYLGVPALQLADGNIIFDLEQLNECI